MKIAGIIAEYNPIHAGHEYHIAETKKRTGADLVIVCMSGSYTQRGIPAFFDKFTRTRDALAAGADIVLEMPLCASLGSAEIFARGGVSLLSAAGAGLLSFGSESGDIYALSALAEIIADEPEVLSQRLRDNLKNGLSYPRAYSEALKYYLTAQTTAPKNSDCPSDIYRLSDGLLSSPNNTLALEYIKAVKKLGLNMELFTVKREGMGYNELFNSSEQGTPASSNCLTKDEFHAVDDCSKNISDRSFPSSSAIREAIRNSRSKEKYLENDDFTLPLVYRLLTHNAATLSEISDINSDMADRIIKQSTEPFTFSELAGRIKSKTITQARINRCLYHILFDIKTGDCTIETPPYIRVLGIRETAGNYLKELKFNAPCPVICRLAKDTELLSENAKKALKKELLAYELYRKVWYSKYGDTLPSDYKTMEVFR